MGLRLHQSGKGWQLAKSNGKRKFANENTTCTCIDINVTEVLSKSRWEVLHSSAAC